MPTDVVRYKPPPTVRDFITDYRPGQLFYDWIIGPVGSGKTTGIFFKLVHMAQKQAPSRDGIRRSRAVVVRNTAPQLRDTTLKSWFMWFRDGQAGQWRATDKDFILRFGDVECEVLFRALDTADDIARVLSLEVTFAVIDEFVQIPQSIVDALSARCGRYPSQMVCEGGATNWGMWGSSNTETEDNWWYEYLHTTLPDNARYFVQPSGFAPNAENLENLPGGRDYYVNQAKGKKDSWINQFIKSEWGFSQVGKPVVGTFNADFHIAQKPILYNPLLPLVMGTDPGLSGTACIFGQEDHRDRLLVMGEIILEGVGAERAVRDFIKPYIKRRFPDAKLIVAPDPAAANRAQTDEKSVVDVLRKHFDVSIETNNHLTKRLDAIEHYTTRITDVGPALLVDPKECAILLRALKGGWKFLLDPKSGENKGVVPMKNAYSHPGDAFGYLCRYFHRKGERLERQRRPLPAGLATTAPRYHFT